MACRWACRRATTIALVTTFSIGGLLAQPPIGWLSDRIDRRLILLVQGVLVALLCGMIAWAGNRFTPLLFVLFFVYGAVALTIYPVAIAFANAQLESRFMVSVSGGLLLLYSFGNIAHPGHSRRADGPFRAPGAVPDAGQRRAADGAGGLLQPAAPPGRRRWHSDAATAIPVRSEQMSDGRSLRSGRARRPGGAARWRRGSRYRRPSTARSRPSGRICRPARKEIDATGRIVLPGGVDSHCHMDQQPWEGKATADDFRSGSLSAMCGGTTTIVPFAMQMRGQSLQAVVDDYHQRAGDKAHIDYGFHLIVGDPSPEVLRDELPSPDRRGLHLDQDLPHL